MRLAWPGKGRLTLTGKAAVVAAGGVAFGAATWVGSALATDLASPPRAVLVIMAVSLFWWAIGAWPPAFTAVVAIVALIISGAAPPGVVFRIWQTPIVWLVISAFLLSRALENSGLSARLARAIASYAGSDYRLLILAAYGAGLILSVVVHQPWPRALLTVTAFRAVAGRWQGKAVGRSVGLAVFAATTAGSTAFLTGDVLLNSTAVSLSGLEVSWWVWAKHMAVPATIATLAMAALHLLLFPTREKAGGRPRRCSGDIGGSPDRIEEADIVTPRVVTGEKSRGPLLSGLEGRAVLILGGVFLLWATDSLHGIHPAWVALGAAAILSLPGIGGLLSPRDFVTASNLPTLVFMTGATALAAASQHTLLAGWIAEAVLPESLVTMPAGAVLLTVTLVTMGVHMVVGSALATLGVLLPALIELSVATGVPVLAITLAAYTAVTIHFLLPFHQISILVGVGDAGGYSNRDVLRLGLGMTVLVPLIVYLVEIPWWQLTGLLK